MTPCSRPLCSCMYLGDIHCYLLHLHQILAPVTVLFYLTFLSCICLRKKKHILCCLWRSLSFRFFLLAPWDQAIISHLEGNAGITSAGNVEKGIKLPRYSLRQRHGDCERDVSSWLLWGKRITFSWRFKHWNTSQGRKGSPESLS